ncbi:hypothetical protein SUGI_1108770 [Cryptomeria japonica]|nr:hypothetical protein SUGI_1108770 [Cryptomeria japonica]
MRFCVARPPQFIARVGGKRKKKGQGQQGQRRSFKWRRGHVAGPLNPLQWGQDTSGPLRSVFLNLPFFASLAGRFLELHPLRRRRPFSRRRRSRS